jgi:hypothetical protein
VLGFHTALFRERIVILVCIEWIIEYIQVRVLLLIFFRM